MKLVHSCIRVFDIEKSIEFYKKAFGFEVKKYNDFPEHKFALAYLALPGDAFEIELTYNYGSDPYEIGNGYSHIALKADDLEALHAEQLAQGLEPGELKGLPGSQPNYYFISDPDGYRVEVVR
ncbi:MAG: VOC family protein [Lactobacillales bacterium]|jgi:lactoylglutathione lyase|nr:VOC family protein [Lactobacillales bacterium]